MECKNTVLKRHLVYKMNRKVEHYLLVGHSRNALRNYSNQIAAAAALLLSENLLVEKQANWKQNAVFGQNCRGSTHEKAQNMTNECSFSALSSYVFLTRCRIYDNLKIWMGGMNYVNVSPTYFRSFFSAGLSQLMAGLTANGQNKAHPSFRFLVFTLHQELAFSRIFVGGFFSLLVNYCQPKLMSSFLSCRRTFWLTNCYLYSVW